MIAVAAFGGGLLVGTAGAGEDEQAASATVTSLVERKVFTDNCTELQSATERQVCEGVESSHQLELERARREARAQGKEAEAAAAKTKAAPKPTPTQHRQPRRSPTASTRSGPTSRLAPTGPPAVAAAPATTPGSRPTTPPATSPTTSARGRCE